VLSLLSESGYAVTGGANSDPAKILNALQSLTKYKFFQGEST